MQRLEIHYSSKNLDIQSIDLVSDKYAYSQKYLNIYKNFSMNILFVYY